MSVGVKGFRIGTGPKGHYVHAGMNGVYYRKSLRGLGDKAEPDRQSQPTDAVAIARTQGRPATYLTNDGVTMRRIISRGAEEMQNGSRSEAIASLNEARQRTGYLLPSLLSGGALTALLATSLQSPSMAVVSAVVTALVSLVAARADVSRQNVVFAYDLDEGGKKLYEALVDALDRLARSDGLWYVDAAGDVNNLTAWKRNAGASQLVAKHKTSVTYDPPPSVQSNITPPCLKVDGKHLYFLPDCILVRERKIYGSVSYSDLRLATRPSRFIVEDTVPRDSLVVGRTWKHPNKKGGPDRRFANNRELPICLFEELGIVSSSGLKALIMASARDAVAATEAALNNVQSISREIETGDHILIGSEG